MNKHNPITNAVRTQLNWTQYMSSLLLQNGSTPLGSQVCRTFAMLQTWDSRGVRQLLTSEALEVEIMKNLKGLRYE